MCGAVPLIQNWPEPKTSLIEAVCSCPPAAIPPPARDAELATPDASLAEKNILGALPTPPVNDPG